MLGQTFYHQTLRKYVIVFGTLFNDINLEKRDGSDNVVSRQKVPIAYGPKQKFIRRIRQDPNLDRQVAISLPRMSFEMTAMVYDPVRKLNSVGTIKNIAASTGGLNTMRKMFNPVPYTMDFQLSIYVDNAEDGTQILEQILPYFTPQFTVTINTIPDMGIKTDVPIILESASQSDEYEGELATRRTIIWTVSFLLKGMIYPDIKTSSVIKQIEVNFRIPGSDQTGFEVNFVLLETSDFDTTDYILLETGNYERIASEDSSEGAAESTVKSRYTVTPSPTTATASDDYGFSETFEFFEPSKNYDVTTGTDV